MTGAELDWSEGVPRSTRFDDVYFSREDGLAESRAVFLRGCGLPEAWTGRRRFGVAELGFGSGLNVLALLDLWRSYRPGPDARLHVFSVEAFPMSAGEAERALGAWPDLADLAAPLLARWPDWRCGGVRVDWPELGARLDLRIGDAAREVEGWTGRADAWFLDGFAPARNPDMWSPALLQAVAARTAPGGRAATFTVSGAVRRGLAEAGFVVDKRPGHGRKKERLEAHLPGTAPGSAPAPRVAVVGGGIAAAALVRALRAEGASVVQVWSEAAGPAASGNAAALVTPRLDAGLGVVARLHAEAFARAAQLYDAETPDAVLARSALQLERGAKDPDRFERLSRWEGFAPGAAAVASADEVAGRLGEAPGAGALALQQARVVEPARVLDAWGRGAEPVAANVARLERADGRWRLLDDSGRAVAMADAVVWAAGAGLEAVFGDLPLRPVRGQATTAPLPFSGEACAWGGYALPTREGVLFGATHGRDDRYGRARADDDLANLAALRAGRPALADRLQASGAPLTGRAAVRLTTPDHLPVAGAAPGKEGVFVLGAFGARGFTLAPWLAEHVAALVVGAPSPVPADLARAVDPLRFARRRAAPA